MTIAQLPAKRCAIHTLAQNFDGKFQTGDHVDVIFVVLLEDALRRLIVRPDCSCFPTAVVARGVRLKQLEPKVLVPARNEKRNAERPQPSESEVNNLQMEGKWDWRMKRRTGCIAASCHK